MEGVVGFHTEPTEQRRHTAHEPDYLTSKHPMEPTNAP